MLKILLIIGFAISGIGDLLIPFSLNVLPFEQYWQILFMLYCSFIVFTNVKVNTLITIIMVLQIFISITSGLINDQISTYTIRTFYIFLMPILAFSAGAMLRKKYLTDFELRLYGSFKVIFWILLIQGLLYLSFNQVGLIRRVGNSIPFIIPVIYLAIYGSFNYLFLAPFYVIFSGKRITIVILFFLGVIASFKNIKKGFFLGAFMSLFFGIFIINSIDFIISYFERWDISFLLNQDLTIGIFDKFSSGRIGQWVGAINTIDSNYKFFLGSGSGTEIIYQVLEGGSTTADTSWYVHNAPLTYFVQTGLVGFLLLLILFLVVLLKARKGEKNLFSYYYFWLIIVTLPFSAVAVVSPLFWFFTGSLYFSGVERKYNQDA